MTNAEKFKCVFGLYATELWAMDEDEMLKWLNAECKEPERKKGRWTSDNSCPFCGFQPWYERDIHTLSYCPDCGSDLREEGEERC